MASKTIAADIASGTGDVAVADKPASLMGWWFQESAVVGAAAEVVIRDGTDATGRIIVRLEFTANENKEPFSVGDGHGIRMNNGIFVDRVSGETQGTVFWA